MTNRKRAHGRYFTDGNPFAGRIFAAWAARAGLPQTPILEPFAGANNLVKTLAAMNWCGEWRAYDIRPAAAGVRRRDTIAGFPRGYSVVVTNPPWLARNSATRRKLPYPQTAHDDLYKHCLDLCLQNAAYVAAIIPASFLRTRLFRDRLFAADIIGGRLFADTENPVCLAMFCPQADGDFSVYENGRRIGRWRELLQYLPRPATHKKMTFNAPDGALGLIAIDNTREPSIRFCDGRELEGYPIRHTSRMITRINLDLSGGVDKTVDNLNRALNKFRAATADMFLTPFKGLRRDGKYRRRIDYQLARDLISVYG